MLQDTLVQLDTLTPGVLVRYTGLRRQTASPQQPRLTTPATGYTKHATHLLNSAVAAAQLLLICSAAALKLCSLPHSTFPPTFQAHWPMAYLQSTQANALTVVCQNRRSASRMIRHAVLCKSPAWLRPPESERFVHHRNFLFPPAVPNGWPTVCFVRDRTKKILKHRPTTWDKGRQTLFCC